MQKLSETISNVYQQHLFKLKILTKLKSDYSNQNISVLENIDRKFDELYCHFFKLSPSIQETEAGKHFFKEYQQLKNNFLIIRENQNNNKIKERLVYSEHVNGMHRRRTDQNKFENETNNYKNFENFSKSDFTEKNKLEKKMESTLKPDFFGKNKNESKRHEYLFNEKPKNKRNWDQIILEEEILKAGEELNFRNNKIFNVFDEEEEMINNSLLGELKRDELEREFRKLFFKSREVKELAAEFSENNKQLRKMIIEKNSELEEEPKQKEEKK